MLRQPSSLRTLVTDVGRRIEGSTSTIHGDPATLVSDITHDSNRVSPGTMFCCVPGTKHDGHDFAVAAVAAGASALLVSRVLPLDAPQVVVANPRKAMGYFAAAIHGWPADSLTMVGVTGTNGKTTTAHLVASILRGDGMDTEVIGTVQGSRTTPESTDLQRQLATFVEAGKHAVVMEVTSHALTLERVVGTRFDVAIFTNLYRDHLDFHGTQEKYFAAKARLFEPDLSDRAVVNRDDVHGKLLIDSAAIECTSFGASDVSDVVVTPRHHEFTWQGSRVRVPLGGRFNVMNSLAAATTANVLGVESRAIAAHLAKADPVPGRYQVVDDTLEPTVIVDYAHDADSLATVISSTRELMSADANVVVVFGCGGDRDRSKRPEMGRIAAELADVVYLTSDNPRSESASAIAEEILSGVSAKDQGKVTIEIDRRAAIRLAVADARKGDVVIVAGKGHETTQTIGSQVLPFDDVLVAREALEVVA
jgi:UDP-N-acetylmuramoyl-L-alanyl-D-glutamate--2,6-diaminopimelate ligase